MATWMNFDEAIRPPQPPPTGLDRFLDEAEVALKAVRLLYEQGRTDLLNQLDPTGWLAQGRGSHLWAAMCVMRLSDCRRVDAYDERGQAKRWRDLHYARTRRAGRAHKRCSSGTPWTAPEMDIVLRLFGRVPDEELLEMLPGRSIESVNHFARNYNLRRRDPLFTPSQAARAANVHPNTVLRWCRRQVIKAEYSTVRANSSRVWNIDRADFNRFLLERGQQPLQEAA